MKHLDEIRDRIFEQEDFGGYGTGTGLDHVFFCRLGGRAYAVFLAELYSLTGSEAPAFRYALYDAAQDACIPFGTPEYDALTADFPKTDGIRNELDAGSLERFLELAEVPDRFAGTFCENGGFSPAERRAYDEYLQNMRALAAPSIRVLYDYFAAK